MGLWLARRLCSWLSCGCVLTGLQALGRWRSGAFVVREVDDLVRRSEIQWLRCWHRAAGACADALLRLALRLLSLVPRGDLRGHESIRFCMVQSLMEICLLYLNDVRSMQFMRCTWDSLMPMSVASFSRVLLSQAALRAKAASNLVLSLAVILGILAVPQLGWAVCTKGHAARQRCFLDIVDRRCMNKGEISQVDGPPWSQQLKPVSEHI